jgi:hypothetical protein
MSFPRRFPYNPKWQTIFFCLVFFGICAVFLGHEANTNTHGMIIDGVITLGPQGATTVLWTVCAASWVFVLMAVLLTLRRIFSPKILELGPDTLVLPHGLFQARTACIPYAEIQDLAETRVNRQVFLHVISGGRKYAITAALFSEAGDYAFVKDFLISVATQRPATEPRA